MVRMKVTGTTASSPPRKSIFWSKRSASAGPKNGLYGAKITGGGTGGTVAVFGKTTALKEHIPQIAAEYSRRVGAMPDIFEGSSSGAIEFGARRYIFGANGWRLSPGMKSSVRKAVIPIAGLGTRHFPASHAVKKEMFPVVGPDGIARALFHYHLLELDASGIEKICIIVQPGEDEMVRAYLRGPDSDYLKRLEKHPALLREAEQMKKFAGRVTFAVQQQQEGYGHAVYQTKQFAGGEFVLLGLGDHLFRGQTGFALSGTGANGGGFRRTQRIGGQPDFRRRIERLRHDCRPAPRR